MNNYDTRDEDMGGKQEIAYQHIKNNILNGNYGAGNRLVADNIAKELHCSVIPVREGIRRLVTEGLVEYVPNVGASVIKIDDQTYADTITAFALIEGYVVALAKPLIDHATINDLTKMIEEMEKSLYETNDLLKFDQLNRSFHEKLYEKCPNTALIDLINVLRTKLAFIRKSIFIFIPNRAEESLKDHKEILRLINSDASFDEIEKYVRGHKLKSVEAFREYAKKLKLGEKVGF